MSKKYVEAAFGKAILDAKFRAALFSNPDKALAGFDLSLAEKKMLKRVDSETLELLANIIKRHFIRSVPKSGTGVTMLYGTGTNINKSSSPK